MSVCNVGGGNHMFDPVNNRWGIEGKDVRNGFGNSYFPVTFGIQDWHSDWSVYDAENLEAKSIGGGAEPTHGRVKGDGGVWGGAGIWGGGMAWFGGRTAFAILLVRRLGRAAGAGGPGGAGVGPGMGAAARRGWTLWLPSSG